jgi:hypothetical protein
MTRKVRGPDSFKSSSRGKSSPTSRILAEWLYSDSIPWVVFVSPIISRKVPWFSFSQLLSFSYLPIELWFGLGRNVPWELIKTDLSQFWLLVPICQWLVYWKAQDTALANGIWWRAARRSFLLGIEEWRSPLLLSPPLPLAIGIIIWWLQ